jgi:signal transduction histidine kinase/CheY-like chemotaxis protein
MNDTFMPTSARSRLSVRARVAIVTGVSGVVFAVLLAAWVVHDQRLRLQDAVGAAVRREAHVAGQFLSALLAERQNQILQLASLPELSSGPGDTGAVRLLIERVRSYHPEIEWLALSDIKGVIQTSSGTRLERSNLGMSPWFLHGRLGPWIGVPQPAGDLAPYLPLDNDGHPVLLLDMSVPVVDYEGRTIGVLVAKLNWRWIVEQQATISAHDPGSRDTLLLGPAGEVWLGPASTMGRKLAPVVGPPVAPGQAPRRVVWPDLGERLSAAAPLPLKLGDAETPGVLVVRHDPRMLLGPGEDLGWRLLGVGLAAATLFMALSWWLAGHITRPLLSLAAAAQALRKGGQAAFLPDHTRQDEIGVLSQSLNDMHEQLLARMSELAAYRDHLEDKISERTEQLKQALERAEAANHTKSAFIANMSHEIRTPMNAILGSSFLMRQSSLPAPQLERLKLIDQAASHLLDIINAILDLSKIEAGMFALHPVPTDLRNLFAKCMDMVSSRAIDKGLKLVLDAEGCPSWVSVDGTRLSQVLINLLANAVKFSERGDIQLFARAQGQVAGLGAGSVALRIEVRDQGIGIEPDKLDRLFNAFVQADESTTRRYGGTGLGLAITRSLVECMGGKVGVTSQLGQGSTFWFSLTLPVVPMPNVSANVAATPPAPTIPMSTPAMLAGPAPSALVRPGELESVLVQLQRRHGGKRILVADDNPVNRMLMAEFLSMAGLRMVAACNGQEALDELLHPSGDMPAMVLMDVHMPGMDGMQATRAIRREPHLAHLPILAMTASVLQQEQEECLRAGMDAHLSKPIDTPELFSCLLAWLDRLATTRDAAKA